MVLFEVQFRVRANDIIPVIMVNCNCVSVCTCVCIYFLIHLMEGKSRECIQKMLEKDHIVNIVNI